jgi:hypothetical protein
MDRSPCRRISSLPLIINANRNASLGLMPSQWRHPLRTFIIKKSAVSALSLVPSQWRRALSLSVLGDAIVKCINDVVHSEAILLNRAMCCCIALRL